MDNRSIDRALGRAVWERGSRLGKDVAGKTSYELEALGRQLRGELEQVGVSRDALAKGVMQADAAVRGAADVFTLGNSAEIAAGMDALLGHGEGVDFASRYRSNLGLQERRDNFDREHRKVARTAGEVGASIALHLGTANAVNTKLDKLPIASKGALGERMSEVKSFVLGDRPAERQVRVPLSSGYTRADHATRSGRIVEAKFGPKATLSYRQRQAAAELGPNYRVDRWLAEHISRPVGALVGGVGILSPDHDRRQ